MNSGVVLLSLALISALNVRAQGTFVYDQQSSIEGNNGEGFLIIQSTQPMGQSFTPLQSSVGFIRLRLLDTTTSSGVGAVVAVNLLENSLTGNILGTASPVAMPNGFVGYEDFFFSAPISVTPGTPYYFQPVVLSGDGWAVDTHNAYGYTGGTAFSQGQALQAIDLWFREGIVVPEPGTWALLLLGFGALCWHRARLR
jgi:hypothetical protein